MNTPGLSIFQGNESIKLDNSLNRAEEEEALEDQRRRDKELNKDLQHAFDDLVDDDDNTIDNSNFQSDILGSNVEKPLATCMGMRPKDDRHLPSYPTNSIQAYEHEFQKMGMLLDSKSRELEKVSKIAHEEMKKREEAEKRLAISEAERERANIAKKSTHELLVESKEKCSNLENVIQRLKSEIKSLETSNNDLIGKLETSQTMLADVQHKYHMVEKNIATNNDRNAELKRIHADERHRADIEIMQQQLDNMNNKFDKKTTELENMHTRYVSLQHSHQTMLIDKASKINDLSKALAEAQTQCQELMCKHDFSQENVRLQRLVADLQLQIQSMERTITNLKTRLEQATADLDVMDSVLQQNNDESFRRLSQTQGRVIGSTPMTAVDRLGHLKDELYRAISNLKNKRKEMRAMQQELDLKNHEIKQLKEEENKVLVEVNMCKEENTRLKNKLKLTEEELDELRSKTMAGHDFEAKQSKLFEEIKHMKEQNQLLQSKLEENKSLQLSKQEAEMVKGKMSAELRILDSKLKNLHIDLEEAKQERDSLKLNYEQLVKENENHKSSQLEIEKLKFLLNDSQKECDRLKNLYVDISNEKEAMGMELANLRKTDICKELQEQKEKSATLSRALQLAEVKCSELTKILETQRISYEKDLSQLREKLEKEKADNFNAASKNSLSNCTKCIDYVAECTKLEIQSLKFSNQCSVYQKEIEVLNSELTEAQNHISDLSDKIVLIDEREKLIVDLKAKAQQFEEYIKTQSSSGASSLKQTGSEDKNVETSPELESKFNRRQVEAKIRDEMAKIFANEIRNNEQRYKVKITQMEEEIVSLRRDLQKINIELIHRQNEVQLLKHAILSERDKTQELIRNKDEEYNEIFQKQNIILHKCRDELKQKTSRVSELIRELDDRNAQIEAERQSMKAVMTQWEEHRRKSDNVKDEWEDKIKEMEKLHESAIALWRTKYNSAKKTAANYKRYSEDKENHMIKEYDRIKSEYDASLAKIEVRVKELFEKKNREIKEATAEMERKNAERRTDHSKLLTDNKIAT